MILPNVRGHITRAEMSSYLYHKCTITKTKVYYSSFLLLVENDKRPLLLLVTPVLNEPDLRVRGMGRRKNAG